MPFLFGSSTNKTKVEPWGPAQPKIKRVLDDGFKAYKKGVGATLPKLSRPTKNAYKGLLGAANANIGKNGMSPLMQGIIDNGGFNGYQTGALNNLQKTANASYDMNANPGFSGVLKQAQDAARNQVDLSASANGRYGSGVAQGAVAREVGNLTDRMVNDDYNRFLGRQDNANQNMFNNAQAGIGNMQSAYSALQDPLKTKLGVGQAYDARKNAEMQNTWDQFSRAMNLFNLQGYSTTKSPGPSPFSQIVGAATDVAKLI